MSLKYTHGPASVVRLSSSKMLKQLLLGNRLADQANFYLEPPWEGGTKVYINGPGHMTKMADMPIYGKNLKNLLLQNQKSYDLETWHVASGTQALQSLYKW